MFGNIITASLYILCAGSSFVVADCEINIFPFVAKIGSHAHQKCFVLRKKECLRFRENDYPFFE